MGLGGCIILIAAGAILTFATDWDMQGVNLDIVGVILMVVGIIGVATFTSIARKRRMVATAQPVVTQPTYETEEQRIRREHGGY